MAKIFTASQRKYSSYKNPVMNKMLKTNKTIAAYAKTVEKKKEIWNAIKKSDGTANSLRRGFGELAYGTSDHLTKSAVGKISGEIIPTGYRYLRPRSVPSAQSKPVATSGTQVPSKTAGRPGWGSFGVVAKPVARQSRSSNPLPSATPPNPASRINNWGEINRPQKLKIDPASKINKANISPSFNVESKDL